ncbi:HEPN domain-containing protein [Amphritea sp.]|uniref:HEPN domain-containing protein n=1 Tax=Amphritea sp. TaxID=1872502 RepID=UPI003D0DB103
MNNTDVDQQLTICQTELASIQGIITGLGLTSNIVPYLTKYSVIRACGTIENAFKTVIADYIEHRSKKQVKRFISKRIREGSANPSFDMICRFLGEFDENWKSEFKTKLNMEPNKQSLTDSLQSLVDARNDFAHGGNPGASITDVITYFGNARRIIEIMDDVIV